MNVNSLQCARRSIIGMSAVCVGVMMGAQPNT